jgi:hypothetical protein
VRDVRARHKATVSKNPAVLHEQPLEPKWRLARLLESERKEAA